MRDKVRVQLAYKLETFPTFDNPNYDPIYIADIQVRLITYLFCRCRRDWCRIHGKKRISPLTIARSQRVSHVAVHNWMSGKTPLSMERMDRIMRWLGISLGELMSEYETVPANQILLGPQQVHDLVVHHLKILETGMENITTHVVASKTSRILRVSIGRCLMALDEIFRLMSIDREEIEKPDKYTHDPSGKELEDEDQDDEEAGPRDDGEEIGAESQDVG